jgi:putative membrane protein
MSIQSRFTPQQLERIKAAVNTAELKISGEIVPVFVERSGHYSIATYRAFLALAGLAFLSIIVFDKYLHTFAIYDPLMIFLAVILIGLIGSLAAHYIDPFKRILMSQSHFDQATRKRAEGAFLREEVFNTRHRTGIMIFVSFFEREVIIMADRGISKVVEQNEWDKMVRSITENIRMGKITEGIEAAIARSGVILLEKGFLKTTDDVNELRDDLRVE